MRQSTEGTCESCQADSRPYSKHAAPATPAPAAVQALPQHLPLKHAAHVAIDGHSLPGARVALLHHRRHGALAGSLMPGRRLGIKHVLRVEKQGGAAAL